MKSKGGDMAVYLGLIESQGNQAYIYSSGRERAARGASELLQASTSTWLLDALGIEYSSPLSTSERSTRLCSHSDRWFGAPDDTLAVNAVVSTSGRAVLLSRDRASLTRVIAALTDRVVREAPGLSVVGSVVEVDEHAPNAFGAAQRDAAERIGRNLATLRPQSSRFQQVPVVEVCRYSQLPTTHQIRRPSGKERVSAQFAAQAEGAASSKQRLSAMVATDASPGLADVVDDAIGLKSWRAVVHADGNGVGAVFMSLGDLLWNDDATFESNMRRWVDGYRSFSIDLEMATETAFADAVDEIGADAVFPILLGGDDITVQVQADKARRFTTVYLERFTELSQDVASKLRTHVAPSKQDRVPSRFSAAAGIAVVKAHFPFMSAYELSESLIASAKTAKRAAGADQATVSAFDMHVLYDSTFTSLDDIRRQRTSVDGRSLWGGPYLVGSPGHADWRTADDLDNMVTTLFDLGRSSQVKDLSAALARGATDAERVLANMESTAPHAHLASARDLIVGGDRTVLLDAIDVADIETNAPGGDDHR